MVEREEEEEEERKLVTAEFNVTHGMSSHPHVDISAPVLETYSVVMLESSPGENKKCRRVEFCFVREFVVSSTQYIRCSSALMEVYTDH